MQLLLFYLQKSTSSERSYSPTSGPPRSPLGAGTTASRSRSPVACRECGRLNSELAKLRAKLDALLRQNDVLRSQKDMGEAKLVVQAEAVCQETVIVASTLTPYGDAPTIFAVHRNRFCKRTTTLWRVDYRSKPYKSRVRSNGSRRRKSSSRYVAAGCLVLATVCHIAYGGFVLRKCEANWQRLGEL